MDLLTTATRSISFGSIWLASIETWRIYKNFNDNFILQTEYSRQKKECEIASANWKSKFEEASSDASSLKVQMWMMEICFIFMVALVVFPAALWKWSQGLPEMENNPSNQVSSSEGTVQPEGEATAENPNVDQTDHAELSPADHGDAIHAAGASADQLVPAHVNETAILSST